MGAGDFVRPLNVDLLDVDPLGVQLLRVASSRAGLNNVLWLPGLGSNRANTPDSAALDVLGDMELIARIAPVDLSPTANKTVIAKRNVGGATDEAYRFDNISSGFLRLLWHDGAALKFLTSTVTLESVGLLEGQNIWVRTTLDIDNGAAGHDVEFFYSTDLTNDPASVSWTQLGTTLTGAGTTSRINSTTALNIGTASAGGSQPFKGTILRAQVLDGIGGTLVFDADFTQVPAGASTFKESSPNAATVTINTSGDPVAEIVADPPATKLVLGGGSDRTDTPDSAALDVLGDLELILRCAPTDLTPAGVNTFLAKRNDGGAGDEAYRFDFTSGGSMRLFWHDGTSLTTKTSTATLGSAGLTDGQLMWLRVTLDVDNGAAGSDVKFYWSLTDTNDPASVSWTQLGSTVTTAGTTSIQNGTSDLHVGMASGTNVQPFIGDMYRARVLDGLAGTVVFDADFTQEIAGNTAVVERSSNLAVATLAGSAALALQ